VEHKLIVFVANSVSRHGHGIVACRALSRQFCLHQEFLLLLLLFFFFLLIPEQYFTQFFFVREQGIVDFQPHFRPDLCPPLHSSPSLTGTFCGTSIVLSAASFLCGVSDLLSSEGRSFR